jgi:hypothetical protein
LLLLPTVVSVSSSCGPVMLESSLLAGDAGIFTVGHIANVVPFYV